MKFLKLIRNNFALLFLAVLAVSGIAFLVWAAGANVNCIAGICRSTTGATDNSHPFDVTGGIFTNDNDTASIECAAGGGFFGGGGNDTFYLRNPQAVAAAAISINGQDGDDVILDGCTTNNILNGGNGNDFIVEDAAGTLAGDNGNDLLAGGQDNDTLGTAGGDPGNDVFIGGPGLDTYNTAANDGDDIVIIHAGDVPPGNNSEQYICRGNDTILMFGFNTDLVLQLTDTTTDQLFGFRGVTSITGECDPSNSGDVCFADPVNNSTGAGNGARYRFSVQAAGNTCTIIVAE